MATTYAAYSNVIAMDKAQGQMNSARTSVSSTSVGETQQKKTRWQRFLDELKPLEEPQEPVGIFTDLRPKKSSKGSQEDLSASKRALKAYRKFQHSIEYLA